MKIGPKLKQARLKKDLTQENVADILNVSRTTISNWEIGRSYPDLEGVVALSDLYNIPLDELLREDEEVIKTITNEASMLKKYLKSVKILFTIFMVLFIASMYFRLPEFADYKKQTYWVKKESQIAHQIESIIKDKDIYDIDSYKSEVDKMMKSYNLSAIKFYKSETGEWRYEFNKSDVIFKIKDFNSKMDTSNPRVIENNKHQYMLYEFQMPESMSYKIYYIVNNAITAGTILIGLAYIYIEFINKKRAK